MNKDIIQLFENCGLEAPSEYLIEGASAKAPQYKVTSPEEFEMLVSQDPTFDSAKDDGKFIDWIFSLWRNFKTDKKNEEKYERAVVYKQEHPEAQLPPKPEKLSQDKLEDFRKIGDYLKVLNKNMKDLKGNISQFKSIADLASFVREIKEKDISVDDKAKDNFKIFREAMADGLEIVYDGPNIIIGVPTTYEASSHFKEPVTDWCTAYPSRYNSYLKDYGGKFYIHLDKHTGELYQAHYESDQFKDSKDNELYFPIFIAKYPELKEFYDKIWDMKNSGWWPLHNKQPSEKEQVAAIKKDPRCIKHIKNPSEKAQLAAIEKDPECIKYIENPSEKAQITAIDYGLPIEYIKNPSEKAKQYARQYNSLRGWD